MSWWAVGTAVVGGLIGSNSSRKAANAQRDATAAARAISDRDYADQAPYRDASADALGKLRAGIDAPWDPSEALQDPGYQFGLRQGQLGLDRKASAAGGRVSGAALKEASRYATDYATTGASAVYQRRQDRLNRLASLAGIGQTSTQASAVVGQNQASLISQQGNANGAYQLAQGNIWGNAVNQLGAVGKRWASSTTDGGNNTNTNNDFFKNTPG